MLNRASAMGRCLSSHKFGLFLLACLVAPTAIQAQSIEDAQRRIQESTLRSHIRFLADDLLEGRGPGSNGDAITQLYLETQFQAMGVQPVDSLRSYRQAVPMLGVTSTPDKVWEFESPKADSGSEKLQLKYFEDFIAVAGTPDPRVELNNAELVFVGYGIQAPEYDWDDYKGVDLQGKILVMMNNDPEDDPELFGGSRRITSAARKGSTTAAGITSTKAPLAKVRQVPSSSTQRLRQVIPSP